MRHSAAIDFLPLLIYDMSMIRVQYAGCHHTEENYTRIQRPKGSGDYLLILFESAMHVMTEETIETAQPSACILYTPGVPQDYSAIRDFRLSYVHFTASESDLEGFSVPQNRIFYPEDPAYVIRVLGRIDTEFYTRDLMFGPELDLELRRLFILFSREENTRLLEEREGTELYRLFLQARYTMLANCEREWASTNMCEMVSLSRSQFYKYYNDFFGISPMADLQEARIRKAKILLTDRRLSVTEVAERCGYRSIQHFSRTFREHCRMSPVNYVKSLGL